MESDGFSPADGATDNTRRHSEVRSSAENSTYGAGRPQGNITRSGGDESSASQTAAADDDDGHGTAKRSPHRDVSSAASFPDSEEEEEEEAPAAEDSGGAGGASPFILEVNSPPTDTRGKRRLEGEAACRRISAKVENKRNDENIKRQDQKNSCASLLTSPKGCCYGNRSASLSV